MRQHQLVLISVLGIAMCGGLPVSDDPKDMEARRTFIRGGVHMRAFVPEV